MKTAYSAKEIFEAYFKRTTEKDELIKRFGQRIEASVNPVTLLDIGCSDGELTLNLLSKFQEKGIDVTSVTGVEPIARSIEEFQARNLPSKTTFNFFHGPAEQFVPKAGVLFDWIIVSHSLYWSADPKEILRRLASVGKNILVVMRDEGGLYEIEKRFRHLVLKPEGFLHSSKDIKAAFTDFGVEFAQEKIESFTKLPRQRDPEFLPLLSFFMDCPLEALTPTAIEAVSTYLDSFGGRFPYGISVFWAKGAMAIKGSPAL